MEAQGDGNVEIRDVGALGEDAWSVVAGWCLDEWAHLFPADTVETYIEMFRWSVQPDADGLPVVLVAARDGAPVGTATLIADDELPDATEPGPWLAAVYVAPEARRGGIGRRLIKTVEQRAATLGFPAIYCYTEHERTAGWYATLGWTPTRTATIAGQTVIVLDKTLTADDDTTHTAPAGESPAE